MLSLFHTRIIAVFIEEGKAFATGDTYLTFIRFFFVLIGIKAITDGVLKGAGDVGVFTLANLVNLGIRVFVARFFSPLYGIQFVWYAVPLGWAVNFLISYIWYRTGHWQKKSLIQKTK